MPVLIPGIIVGGNKYLTVLTRNVLNAVWIQSKVPVESAESEVRRLQLALGAPGRRTAVLVLERVSGGRVVCILDLVVMVH